MSGLLKRQNLNIEGEKVGYMRVFGRDFKEHVAQARAWVHRFVTWYNTQHRHRGIEFVTPEQRHQGQDGEILQKRKLVYAQAKECKPERWKNRNTRRWCKIKEVWLNPPRENLCDIKQLS